MKKDKLKGYESPNLELVELRFEGMICGSNNYGTPGQAGGDVIPGNNYNL